MAYEMQSYQIFINKLISHPNKNQTLFQLMLLCLVYSTEYSFY